jgi:hypothetical protein
MRKAFLCAISIAYDEGQLNCNVALDDMLWEIAEDFPDVMEVYGYVYRSYVEMAWRHTLLAECRSAKPEDRPVMPQGWWPGDRTLDVARKR